MEIDPRFKQAKKKSSRRKFRQNHGLKLAIGGSCLVVAALIAWVAMSGLITISAPPTPDALSNEELTENLEELGEDLEEDITATSTSDALAYASAFIDVAGDPMVLRFDASLTTKAQPLPSHSDLPLVRVGPFAIDTLILVQDDMITRQEKLITTLPSSREEFAFFQAKRTQGAELAPTPVAMDIPDLEEISVDAESLEGDSWGDSVDGSETTADSFTQTVIENTTSLTIVKRETQRQAAYNDLFLRLKDKRALVDILKANDFDEDAAKAFQEKGAVHIPVLAELPSDHVLAVRSVFGDKGPEPVQVSIYTSETYIGSVALEDDGSVVPSADPWVQDELFSYVEDDGSTDTVSSRKYRLLDAFYSAAIRNGVPTSVVGETIVLLSQDHDLEAFATTGDRMTLLYAREPGPQGAGPGQVLFASIEGPSGDKICYVAQVAGEGYKCFAEKGVAGPAGGAGSNGMVTPVSGVLTSPFGPRFHPILKKVKVHHGVDWAAPTGTPILAAFDGRVSFAGNGGGYGNVIKVAHAGGRETRYAHLSKFSPLGKVGTPVRAGDVIGFVGTTGRSTGPHLHFELRERGQSMDPFTAPPVGAVASAPTIMGEASGAVESLVNQIIKVESAGNARAKNTRSSATGLGQFISSTWIRMMKTYRPDLASTMSREALLDLRFDPTISREMVTQLAREGEAYLRARGHAISAGRLYLCHFLGAQGAHVALSAPDNALILDVMGPSVIKANPFLRGRDIAWVKNWAERKMNRKGGRLVVTNAPSAPAVARIPPEVVAYKKTIKAVLETAG